MTQTTDQSPLSGGILQNPEQLVAVLPPENLTADTSLDYLARLASLSISEGLESAELCGVVPFDKVSELAQGGAGEEGGPSDLRQTWTEETAATLAVVGHYFAAGDSLRFQLQVRDRSGELKGSVPSVSGPREDPSQALEGVRVAAVSTVAGIVAPGHDLSEVAWGSHLPNLEALNLYRAGREEQARRNYDAALALYDRAMEIDPDYLRPLISTLESLGNRERWQEADSVCRIAESRVGEMTRIERLMTDGDCARIRRDCLAELHAARQLLEFNPIHVNDVGVILLCLNRPREAAEYFLQWDPHASRETWEWTPNTWNYLGWAYHLLGEYEEELKVARDIRESFPDNEIGFQTEVSALAALGRTEELEPVMEEWASIRSTGSAGYYALWYAAAELDAHGHSEAARDLLERVLQWFETRGPVLEEATPVDRRSWGILLLLLDRLEEARPWLEGLAAEYPGNMQFQALLGILEGRLGDRAGAEQISQALAEWDAPFLRGENTLYRAYIAANLGDLGAAVRLLEQAVAEARPWNWWRLRFDRDPYLKPLRGYPPFEDFIEPRG
jgi:tetratricopeptide (TPR) repeat protein